MLTIPEAFVWPAPWVSLQEESQHLGLPVVRAGIFGGSAIASNLAEELTSDLRAGTSG